MATRETCVKSVNAGGGCGGLRHSSHSYSDAAACSLGVSETVL